MSVLVDKGKKLYLIPARGKVKGVCAGIADYLNIPVQLLRIIVMLSMFCGLFFFTLICYFGLALLLDKMPDNLSRDRDDKAPGAQELLQRSSQQLSGCESSLRNMERYVTSETFSVRSRFRQL